MISDIDRRLFAKRICIFVGVAALWVLACFTMGVQLKKPSNQFEQGYAYLKPNLNAGDTAWMLIASILGLMLSPFLAFYHGCTEGKTSSSLVYVTIVTISAVAMIWVILGFSLCYGPDATPNSILGNPFTYFAFRNVGAAPEPQLAGSIPLSIFALYELSYAILAPTIMGSALNGRVNMIGWLFFIVVWHLVLYCPLNHIVWAPSGWFSRYLIRDYAGGIVVNMVGGISAAAVTFVLGPRRVQDRSKIEPNAPNVLVSLTLVWLSWFALNAGKSHAADSIAAQSVLNSMVSCCASILLWILIDFLVHKKSTLVSIGNAIMVSLVTMSPSAGFFTTGGAIVASLISVLITYTFGYRYTKELVDCKRSLSVLTIHGFTGTISFLLTAIFSYKFINENAVNGITFGSGMSFAYHLAATVLLIPCIFISAGTIFYLADRIVPIRAEDEFFNHSASDEGSSEKDSIISGEVGSVSTAVEMFDLFNNGADEEESRFLKSGALYGEFGGSEHVLRAAEMDSAINTPGKSSPTMDLEEAGYSEVSDVVRTEFRNELQQFISSKMAPRSFNRKDKHEAAI